jgi:hypothetical protein
MSSGAWAAWAAVKIATEAALRADAAVPEIAAALRRRPFDAHKDVAMCRGTPRVMEVEP